MHLARFAWLSVSAELPPIWRERAFAREDVTVRFGSVSSEVPGRVLVIAETPISGWPTEDGDDLAVPHRERLLCETSLEAVADVLSVAAAMRTSLSSPSLSVAFRSATTDERSWLAGHRSIVGASEGIRRPKFHPHWGPEILPMLDDREDGVGLLADARSASGDAAEFRELLRFFERAFAESSERLVAVLWRFLSARPGLRYSKNEVKQWIVRLRGPAIHADRSVNVVRASGLGSVTGGCR
jgi:hypothetical protein